jgi:hypothetical protein
MLWTNPATYINSKKQKRKSGHIHMCRVQTVEGRSIDFLLIFSSVLAVVTHGSNRNGKHRFWAIKMTANVLTLGHFQTALEGFLPCSFEDFSY